MTRWLTVSLLVLLNLAFNPPGTAGVNTTVILSGVTIPSSINEGESATLKGNIGDLALTQNDRFLNQLFVDLLGRSIDPGELDSFNQLLASNTSRQPLATSLLGSAEYRAGVVRSMYVAYLQRDADAAALSAFVALLDNGATREQLAATIIGSEEYFQKRANNRNADFLSAVYLELLNRPIDVTALAGLTAALNSGTSRAQVAAQILASNEYRQRSIQNAYTTFLRRAVDPAALSTWLNALASGGATYETFIVSLVGSQEYFSIVPKTTYRMTVNWGDGPVETVEIQPPAQQNVFFPFEISHRYLDNKPKGGSPAPINVFLTLQANTGVATSAAQLFVKNVAPQLRNVAIPTPSGIGTLSVLTGDIIDPGESDVFTLIVDWGEGRGAEIVSLPAGSAFFKLTHTYATGGNLQPGITIKDDDGAIANVSLPLFVTPFVLLEAIPSIPVLLPADDSGVAPNDAITSVTKSLRFSGRARIGDRVELFANGQQVGFNNADGSGQWSIIATPSLSDGTYQITARATDGANNVSLPSQPLILVIDTKPPLPPSAPDLDASSDTGASNSDNITTASVRLIGGLAEPGALIELYVGANLIGIANVDFGGKWIVEETRLGPGTHVFVARMKDRAGNLSAFSTPLTVTISGTLLPPSTPLLDPQSDVGLSNNDLITSQSKPTFVGTAEANARIQLLANERVVGATSTDASGRWSATVGDALADGKHSFVAKTADTAGNTSSASSALVVTIDTTSPAPPSALDLTTESDNGTSNTDNITSITTPTIAGSAEAGSLVELLVNGASVGSTIAAGGQWNIALGKPLSDGTYQVTARATDVAGNRSPVSAALVLTIKTPEARLAVARFQSSLLLSWPSGADGFVLEVSDSPGSHVWSRVDRTPTVEGDAKIVILTAGSGTKFYRLRKN